MADITKIQPIGDSIQYTLGARYLTHTPNNTTTFLRGDNTWSNTLTGGLSIQTQASATNALNIQRGGAGEATSFWVDDSYLHVDVINDETTANIQIKLQATDTESGGGAGAQTSYVTLAGSGGKSTVTANTFSGALNGNATTSSSCTGNAASATKLQTARNIWGKSFNGTADISGNMTNVGPGMYLPSGQSRFQFLTSSGGAGNGYFGKVGLCGTYATIDSNIGSHLFYNNGTSRVDGTIYRPNSTLGNSWVGSRGLPYSVIAVDASDSTSSVAYTLEAIKFQTNTYGMCAERAGETYGIIGWKNNRTANGYDAYFYVSKDCYFRCTTRVYGAVWNDYAEKRNIPEAQKTDWIDEECIANPLAGRCVREVGDDTMVLSDARMQKGCKIISDTFGFSIGETEDCKTSIAVSGRVLAYLLEDREVAKEHIGDFVCSGPNGTVSIMTTEEYFKCPQAVVGTISAVPDYEVWGTGNVKVNGRIWIYVR